MVKIGVSQRTYHIESRNETRDELDQALITLLSAKGFTPVPIPNSLPDIKKYLSEINVKGFVFSGGNDSDERENTEHFIIEYAIQNSLPILGICHGLQLINKYFGGSLSDFTNHVGQNHEVKFLDYGLKYSVNSFHDIGIKPEGLSSELDPIAICAADESIESAAHKRHKIAGIMWHPERKGCPEELTNFIFKEFFDVQ